MIPGIQVIPTGVQTGDEMNDGSVNYICSAGTFAGYRNGRFTHVQGIRYACSKRFCPPVPFRYEEGLQICDRPAPYAVQCNSKLEYYFSGIEYESVPQEESPQYLSLTIPDTKETRKPVMVWFHGGGFRNGGCDSPIFNYELLAGDAGAILVGINYRIGILGFSLDETGKPGHPGLLDALEGLRWVKKNISGFGGDPENITLFGQSAGAELVRCIILSKGTENLYNRAILQSDPIGTMHDRQRMEEEVLAKVRALPPDISVEELRRAQREILDGIKEKGLPKYMVFAPRFGVAPLIDAEQIPQRLKEAAGTHELLIGCTSREVSIYGGTIPILAKLDRFIVTRGLIEYLVRRMSRSIFNGPSREFAQAYAAAGGKVYWYCFDWLEDKSFIAAGHMMDVPLLFGAEAIEGRETALSLSPKEIEQSGRVMRQLWGMFAHTGCLMDDVRNELLKLQKIA